MGRTELIHCDWCAQLDYALQEATKKVEFTIEGLHREWDLCDPHYRPFNEILFIARRTGDAETDEPNEPRVEEDAEVSAAVGPPAKLQELESDISRVKKELTALVEGPVRTPVLAKAVPQLAASQTLFQNPQDHAAAEGTPEEPPQVEEATDDSDQRRVLCMTCVPPAEMLFRSRGMHVNARGHQGVDVYDLKWEGIGFEIPPQPGTRDPQSESVICPRNHYKHAAKPFWVPIERRTYHAGSHGVLPTDIAWQDPMRVLAAFTARCTVHEGCRDYDEGRGYPFRDARAVKAHVQSLARRR